MRFALFLFALLLLGACGKEETWEPPIAGEELPAVVADLLILEAAIKELPNRSRDSLSVIYYERVLGTYSYTLDEFQQSLRWMQEDPTRMTEVYNEALNLLTVRESELNQEEK